MSWLKDRYRSKSDRLFAHAVHDKVDHNQQRDYLQIARHRIGFNHYIAGIGGCTALAFVGMRLFVEQFDFHHIFSFALALATVLGFAELYHYVLSKKERRHLSRMLAQDAIRPHVCLICTYNLQGSVSEHCPECGEPLAPVNETAASPPVDERF